MDAFVAKKLQNLKDRETKGRQYHEEKLTSIQERCSAFALHHHLPTPFP